MGSVPIFLSALFLMQLSPAEQTRLTHCLDTIQHDAETAYEDGLAWTYEGNRPAARQCVALALIALGHEDEGAARLEDLANATDGGTLEQRGVYLAQAGNAWLQAGAAEAADVTLTNALKLSPDDADLYIDRAGARMILENWDQAIDDLDKALSLKPGYGPAHQLRAEARLNLKSYDLALADIKAAMLAEPDNIDTLVLRGQIREAMRLSDVKQVE